MSLSTPIAQRIRWGTADAAAERIRWIAGSLCLALSIALAIASPAGAASPSLERIAADDPGRDVTAIVQFRSGVTAAQAAELVKDRGGDLEAKLPSARAVAAEMNAGDAVRLERSPLVLSVSRNARVKPQAVGALNDLVATYPTTAGAKDAWTSDRVSGAGVGIAVIDTGIAGQMADFRVSQFDGASRVTATAVANPLATTAADTVGHGTHVAGIIAGNGNNRWWGDPQRGKYIGIAPDANLISVKVDNDGDATVLDVIRGLDFVIQHRDVLKIRVVNLSLSSTEPSSYRTDPLDAAVESAWKKGLVVVTAAGNRGGQAGAVDYAPGNDPFAITVGAFDENGSSGPSDDAVSSWSSRGTTMDGIAKPEVYAPGVRMVSTLAPSSGFTVMCPTCVLGSYIRASGTSMSAPVVSGIAALLLERYPNLTPDQVKGSIARYARTTGNGIVSAHADRAVEYVGSAGPVTANQGIVPNEAVDAATGDVDETRSRWSRSSWSSASGDLAAGFARSSWSCADCVDSSGESVDGTRSSWSRSSWSRSSWSNWSAE